MPISKRVAVEVCSFLRYEAFCQSLHNDARQIAAAKRRLRPVASAGALRFPTGNHRVQSAMSTGPTWPQVAVDTSTSNDRYLENRLNRPT